MCRKATMKSDWQTKLHNIKLKEEGGNKIKEKTAQQWIPIEKFEEEGFIKLKERKHHKNTKDRANKL